METPERKPYRPPQITRVVLRKEQAILTACYTGTTSASGRTGTTCKSTATVCRRTTGQQASNPS